MVEEHSEIAIESFNTMRASAQTIAEYEFDTVTPIPNYFDHQGMRTEITEQLARELHDRLGPSLSTIRYQIETLLSTSEKTTEETLTHLHAKACDAQKDLRDLLNNLRQTEPSHVSVRSVLESKASELRNQLNLDVTLSLQDEKRLPKDVEHEFAQIAFEALNNICQHAQATTVQIFWSCGNAYAALEIADNGKGFLPDSVASNAYGVCGMYERSAKIGAKLNVQSNHNEGTIVSCILKEK